jgi:hypothetical protein
VSYINLPTLDPDFIMPSKMSFNTKGGAISGGRNALGHSINIDMTGGGLIVGSYENCFIHDPEQHEYINWLAANLNDGIDFMNIPILTDWMGPFPTVNGIPQPIVSGIPHSDGSTFSDGSGYSQATVWGILTANAAVGAGIVSMRVYGAARPLRWSDWCSIKHPSMGWRAWRYKKVLSKTKEENPVYQLAITPPLREAAPAGTRVELARPKCAMGFPADFTLPWEIEGFYFGSPTLQFVEAF